MGIKASHPGSALIVLTITLLAGCATGGAGPAEGEADRYGIHIEGVRHTAAGYMLDFRYRVVDAQRAATVIHPRLRPYLVDQQTGKQYVVPAPGRVGPLRQTRSKVEAGRTYFVFFANPGRAVARGTKVSVIMGDLVIKDLTVR
jgi:hypothetical protein